MMKYLMCLFCSITFFNNIIFTLGQILTPPEASPCPSGQSIPAAVSSESELKSSVISNTKCPSPAPEAPGM